LQIIGPDYFDKVFLVMTESSREKHLDTSGKLWQDFRKKHHGQRTGKVAFDSGFMDGIRSNHEMMFKA
jgi:hypothetical protein